MRENESAPGRSTGYSPPPPKPCPPVKYLTKKDLLSKGINNATSVEVVINSIIKTQLGRLD